MARQRRYSTEYERRNARARAMGWSSYSVGERWRRRLKANDNALTRQLAEEIGGPVEPERAGSLMSIEANAIVNPKDVARSPEDWRVRLLRAAGRIEAA